MAFTFDDLKTEIKDTFKRDDIDGLIDRVLIEAVNSICDEYPFSWLRAQASLQTIAGTSSYGITDASGFSLSDYRMRYDVRLEGNNSSLPLVYLAPDLFLKQFGINTDRGFPEAYTEWEMAITLYPVPDGAYTLYLRYIKLHPSSGTILVPEKEVVKRAAMMRLYMDLDMPELAQPHALMYQKLLMQLLQREHHLDYIPRVAYCDL